LIFAGDHQANNGFIGIGFFLSLGSESDNFFAGIKELAKVVGAAFEFWLSKGTKGQSAKQ